MKYNQKLYEKVNEKYQNIATSQLSDQAFCKEVEKNIIASKGEEKEIWESLYLSTLLEGISRGYTHYNIKELESRLEYQAFKRMLKKTEVQHFLYRAVLHLWNGEYDEVFPLLEEYLDSFEDIRIKPLTEFEFLNHFVLPLKNGYSGMWNQIAVLLKKYGTGEDIIAMCYALEKYYYHEKWEEATDVLAIVLQKNPNFSIAKELLANVYYEMKYWKNAIFYYQQVEDLEINERIAYPEAIYFNIAWAYSKIRDYKQEELYYRKALDMMPSYPNAKNNLGWSLLKQKKYEEAEQVLRECVKEERDFPYSINNLCESLMRQEKLEDLTACVNKYHHKIGKWQLKNIEKKTGLTFDFDKKEKREPEETNMYISGQETQFSNERLLEEELWNRLDQGKDIFGMHLKIYEGPKGYGRQFIIPVGRLDLLAVDEDENYYVIELKKDSGYKDAYEQTVSYVKWIQKNMAKKSQKVYGIICLNQPTQELVDKVRNDKSMRLFEYHIHYQEIK